MIESVPGILSELETIEPQDDFQRRDLIDLARTVTDRALIVTRHRLMNAFDAWTEGRGSADEVRRLALSYRRLVAAATDLLALHEDYSMCGTLEHMAHAAPGVVSDFGRVLLDNAINDYCRSHQYEIAAGWYRPFANDLTDEILRRLAAGEKAKLEEALVCKLRTDRWRRMVTDGIMKYRPALSRTSSERRRILREARSALTLRSVETPSFLPRAVAYQVVFRNFTREGTIRAATEKLEHVRAAGVDIVYLAPFVRMDEDMDRDGWSPRQIKSGFGSPKNPYRIADYDAVDPEYGTEDDLRQFVARAHALGLRVVFDLVYLHCGPNNVIRKAIPDAFERNPDGSVRMTRWKFPYINFKSAAVREYLWANMQRFVRDVGCDGFRCDVGDEVPIDFWEEGVRRCRAFRSDLVMINEGDRIEWLERAFHVGYAWTIANCVRETLKGRWKISFGKFRTAMADYEAKMPQEALLFNFMDNHDTAADDGENRFDRILPVEAGNAGFVVQFLRKGVPVVFNGNEIADNARSSFFGPVGHPLRESQSVDWRRAETPDGRIRLALIRRLSELRHSHPALGEGTMTYLTPQGGECVFAFVRSSLSGRKLLVAANLSRESCDFTLPDLSGKPTRILLQEGLTCSGERFNARPYGYLVAEIE